MRIVPSSIDRLPDQAVPAVQEAWDRIKARRSTQLEILAKLNDTLVSLGLDHVSTSAFNRWTMRVRGGQVLRPTLPEATGSASVADVRDDPIKRLAAGLRRLADDLEK